MCHKCRKMIIFSDSDKDYSIVVTNARKVSEILGVELKYEEELTSMEENKKIKKFLNKYNDLLHSISIKNIKEFYKQTGLHIMHLIYTKESPLVFLDSRGIFCTEDRNHDLKNVFDLSEHDIDEIFHQHLLIITKAKRVLEDAEGVYLIDKQNNIKYLYNFKEEREDLTNRRKPFQLYREITNTENEGIESSLKILQENIGNQIIKEIEKQEIKQIEYIPDFNDVYILLEDGTLYENNKIYAKNVRTIFKLTKTCYYIIYEDETIELLTSAISSMRTS